MAMLLGSLPQRVARQIKTMRTSKSDKRVSRRRYRQLGQMLSRALQSLGLRKRRSVRKQA